MRNFVHKDGRKLAEVFEYVPTRKELPHYHKVIKNPIDLGSIEKFLAQKARGAARATLSPRPLAPWPSVAAAERRERELSRA